MKLLEHVVGLLPVVRANYGVGGEGNGAPKDGTEGLLVRMGHTWVTRVGRSKHFLHSCKFVCRLLAESNQMGCNQSKIFKATTSRIRTLPYLQTMRRMHEEDELKPYHHPILFFSLFSSTTMYFFIHSSSTLHPHPLLLSPGFLVFALQARRFKLLVD